MVKLHLDNDETGRIRDVKALKGRPDLVAPAEAEGKLVRSALELELNLRFAPSYNRGE